MSRFKAKYTTKNKTSIQLILTKFIYTHIYIYIKKICFKPIFIKMKFGELSNLENNL